MRVEGTVQEIAPRGLTDGALVTVDSEGRFSSVNEEASALLGLPATQLQGRGLWALFPKTARLRIEAQVRAALAGRTPLDLEELDARQERWLELHEQIEAIEADV